MLSMFSMRSLVTKSPSCSEVTFSFAVHLRIVAHLLADCSIAKASTSAGKGEGKPEDGPEC